MSEELMNNELLEVEETYEPEEVEESNGIIGKVVAGVGVVTIGAGVALVVKNRDKVKAKLEERKIRKLEKAGYVIYKPEDVEEAEEAYEETEEEK